MNDQDQATGGAPSVSAPRIGNGVLSMVAGAGVLLTGTAVAAGAGDSSDPGATAGIVTLFIGIGGGLIAVGFLKWLFHMIERRLIDIETATRSGSSKSGPLATEHDAIAEAHQPS